jgi:tetratricopeptide (TPR) repeat protein
VRALLACWLCSATGAATAQDAAPATGAVATDQDREARFLFEAGRTAYDAGRYGEALGHFQHAFELSKRPALLYNVGQAADRMRRDEVALQAFKQYVAELPEAPNRTAVEERIRVLEGVVAEKQAALAAAQATSAAAAAQTSPQASAHTDPMDPTAGEPTADQDENLLEQWWLWAAAGGVVATVVIVALVAGGGGGGGSAGELTPGSDGKVVVALSLP